MFPHPISGSSHGARSDVTIDQSNLIEEKAYDGESDLKQQQHRKAGSFSEKLGVTAAVIGAKLAPAGEWIQTKSNQILPEKVTHAQAKEDARITAEHQRAAAERDLGATAAPAAAPLPTLRESLNDVAQHTAESFHNHVMVPLNNNIIAPLDRNVLQPGMVKADAMALTTATAFNANVTGPVGVKLEAGMEQADSLALRTAHAFNERVVAPLDQVLQSRVVDPVKAQWNQWSTGVAAGQVEAHKAQARADSRRNSLEGQSAESSTTTTSTSEHPIIPGADQVIAEAAHTSISGLHHVEAPKDGLSAAVKEAYVADHKGAGTA